MFRDVSSKQRVGRVSCMYDEEAGRWQMREDERNALRRSSTVI